MLWHDKGVSRAGLRSEGAERTRPLFAGHTVTAVTGVTRRATSAPPQRQRQQSEAVIHQRLLEAATAAGGIAPSVWPPFGTAPPAKLLHNAPHLAVWLTSSCCIGHPHQSERLEQGRLRPYSMHVAAMRMTRFLIVGGGTPRLLRSQQNGDETNSCHLQISVVFVISMLRSRVPRDLHSPLSSYL